MTMEYFDSLQSTLVFLILTSSPVSCEFFPMTATKSGDYDNAPNAYQVVDGNQGTCTTAAESNGANRNASVFGWIQVDMGNPFSVISVTLTAGEATYFRDFVVLLSPSNSTNVQPSMTCATFNNGSSIANGTQITLTCSPYPVVGRYITIKREGGERKDAISLCEVVISRNPTAGYIYLYNLQTSQIGAFDGWNSTFAVDLDPQTCAQPVAPEIGRGWWSIDLLRNYNITTITVYNSNTGSTQYLSQFEVKVGPTADENNQRLCYNYTDSVPAGGNATFDCAPLSIGRFLNITRWGSPNTKALYLCEIYIKGQPYDGTIPPVLTSTGATSITSASTSTTESTTTSISNSYSLSPSSSLSSSSLSSSSSSNSSPPFLPSATSYSSTSIGNNYTSSSPVDDSSESNTRIIIICVVVIIGGCLLLGSLGVAAFLLIRRRRRENDPEKEPKKSIGNFVKPKPPPKPTPELRKPITSGRLVGYVSRKKAEDDNFKNEFKKLPDADSHESLVGKRPENSSKNRFKNILPYDHTIVPLVDEEFDDHKANYINANYITGYKNADKMFIATQGPKVETVNDFWRMIWQQDVDLIVMITLVLEDGKKKCEQYWPSKVNMKKTFNNITVQLTREEKYAYHVYREMTIQDIRKEEPPRTVRQMHFMEWKDKQRPDDFLSVLCFRKKVRSLQINTSGPVVVHCSAGVGRTGTYIALDSLLEQLKHEGAISFFKCAESLRHQRMHMIQTSNQYVFLHDAIAHEQQTGDTAIPCATFATQFSDLAHETPEKYKLKEQFELLKRLKETLAERESAGTQPENIHKNRNKDIVAYDDARPYLEVIHQESDYINAVYVDGYRKKDAVVLTQLPLKDTVQDFWRLLWDHRLKTIVLLDEVDSNDESCPKFWPEEGETETYGSFTVKMSSTTEAFSSVLLREFLLSNTSQKPTSSLTVRQYQIKDWPKDAAVPNSCRPMLDVILGLPESTSPEEALVIQCTDGATRSGLFATAMYMIDMMKEEQIVDVFLACQFIAANRHQIISSFKHYSFLHEMASAYIKHTEETGVYMNAGNNVPVVKNNYYNIMLSEDSSALMNSQNEYEND